MTLHQYFKQEYEAGGQIDHALRVSYSPADGSFSFSIHPSHVSGTTADFVLWENPESGFDMLMPQDSVRPIDSQKFKAFLKARLDYERVINALTHEVSIEKGKQ